MLDVVVESWRFRSSLNSGVQRRGSNSISAAEKEMFLWLAPTLLENQDDWKEGAQGNDGLERAGVDNLTPMLGSARQS